MYLQFQTRQRTNISTIKNSHVNIDCFIVLFCYFCQCFEIDRQRREKTCSVWHMCTPSDSCIRIHGGKNAENHGKWKTGDFVRLMTLPPGVVVNKVCHDTVITGTLFVLIEAICLDNQYNVAAIWPPTPQSRDTGEVSSTSTNSSVACGWVLI